MLLQLYGEPIDDHRSLFFQLYDVAEVEIICGMIQADLAKNEKMSKELSILLHSLLPNRNLIQKSGDFMF
jgi:hypothetical protein